MDVPALTRIDADGGQVSVEGEYWSARSESPIEAAELAQVVGIQGLTLEVKPAVSANVPSQET